MARSRVPIDLLQGKQVARRWQSGEPGGWAFREITYGTFAVHGWFVARTGRRWDGCWTVVDERECCEVVAEFMTKASGWTELPAEPAVEQF